MSRRLETLEVPKGPSIEAILPRLSAALAGDGPALLPVPASDPATASRAAAALRAGAPLDAGEDDGADPTALVIATSGSTGTPKGTLLPASALVASAAATQARLGGPGTWLLALPAHHVAGLQVLLRSVAAGSSPHVLDTAVPFTADRFVAAVAALTDSSHTGGSVKQNNAGPAAAAARRYVSLVPTQLHRILLDEQATAAAREFDAILVGGSSIPPSLLDAARSAGVTVVTTYGMSETCGGCVYDGRPLDGVTAGVGDDGRIRLTGPMVARGYRGRPGDRAFPGSHTFVTDDLGTVGDDGTVSVLGRADDVIVSGGVKVPPAPVEAALATVPGVAQAVVVGVPDPQWGQVVTAVITLAGAVSTAPDLDATRPYLDRAALPAAHRPRRLVVVDAIPALGPGKPDRVAAVRLATAARPAVTSPGVAAEPAAEPATGSATKPAADGGIDGRAHR